MAHHNQQRHEECVALEHPPSIHNNYNWWVNNDLHACSLLSSSWSTSCSSSTTCWQNHAHDHHQHKNNIINYNNSNNYSAAAADDHQSSGSDENVSISTSTFTNVSNHDSSELSAESVRNNNIFVESGGGSGSGAGDDQFVGDTVVGSDQHQLWNHLLLNIGCGEELQTQDSAGMFINNPTTLLTTTSLNNGVDHLIGSPTREPLVIKSSSPPSSSSDMVVDDPMINIWQIPNQDSTTTTIGSTTNHLLSHPHPHPPLPHRDDDDDDHNMMNMMMMLSRNNQNNCDWGSVSCSFGRHHMKLQGDHDQEHGGGGGGDHQYYSSRINDSRYWGSRNLDLMRDGSGRRSRSFGTADITSSSCYNNNLQNIVKRPPLMLDINLSKPFIKTLDLSAGCCRNTKQGYRNSAFPSSSSISKTPTKRNGRAQGREGRKSEQNSYHTVSNKPKPETSSVPSSTKVPKVRLGDKITALQQIVSPFGKTDTASVLWEAIGYIRFLQEQIQLLSTPYLKGCASKEIWGGGIVERNNKERGDNGTNKVELLRSRGLCLVPISSTVQVVCPASDNNNASSSAAAAASSDFFTPLYRGCLYR